MQILIPIFAIIGAVSLIIFIAIIAAKIRDVTLEYNYLQNQVHKLTIESQYENSSKYRAEIVDLKYKYGQIIEDLNKLRPKVKAKENKHAK